MRLRRRIVGADYPAQTAEELLEKIEAAGGVGVAFGLADDPRWGEWAWGRGGGRRMLLEFSAKRRVFLVELDGRRKRGGVAVGGGGESGGGDRGPGGAAVVAAVYRGMAKTASYEDVPEALLESDLARRRRGGCWWSRRSSARRCRRCRVGAGVAVDGGGAVVREIVRQGFAVELADGRVVWTEYAEQLRSLALRRQRRAASTADVAALQRHLLHWQHVDLPREGVDALEDALDMFVGLALPLELWEQEVLPLRVKEFMPAMLDGICLSGHRVWVGSGGGMTGASRSGRDIC